MADKADYRSENNESKTTDNTEIDAKGSLNKLYLYF